MAGFSGRTKLTQIMRRLGPAVRKAAKAQLDKNADEFVGDVKHFTPVDKGDLKATPYKRDTSTAERISVRVSVGGPESVARPVEFGHDGAEPSPFFFPAYRAKKRKYKRRMTVAAKAAMKRVIAGGSE